MTRLPPDALAWLREHGVEAMDAERLARASTAQLFSVGDLVLRWYEGGSFLEEEPDAIAREVAALSSLEGTDVPAPRLVAWSDDPPAVLMTRLAGHHELDAHDPGLVNAVLASIHATDPRRLAAWTYRGYHEGLEMTPPSWWGDRRVWERALDLSANRRPIARGVVIHRDFHPGNLLWVVDAISGIVDWGNACIGPAEFDLAHYRVNLASLVGPEVADREFPGDPGWDIEAALGYVDPWNAAARDRWVGPWPHIPVDIARRRVETFVARALARSS